MELSGTEGAAPAFTYLAEEGVFLSPLNVHDFV